MSSFPGSADPQWPNLLRSIAAGPDTATIGVSVRSLDDGREFDHSGSTLMSSASSIKILILAALAQAVDRGQVSLDDRASAVPGTRVGGSGVLNWLGEDVELSLRDHAWLMIAISDNTASNVLIDAAGMSGIGECAARLCPGGTSLNRRFLGRLPEPGQPENLACAADLVRVLTAIWDDTAASPSQCAWMRSLLADQKYRDRIPRRLPESVAYAGKTGSLAGYSHDCGVLSGPGGNLAIAVLTRGFDDPYDADALIGDIARAAVSDFLLETPRP
jgi:beta-lactamase class A